MVERHGTATTATWSWGGLFEVEVPEGWAVERLRESVQVVAADGVTVAHITVLHPNKGEEPAVAASRMAGSFAASRGAPLAVGPEVVVDDLAAHAAARFEAKDGAWVVRVVVWDEFAVVCTANSAAANQSLLLAADAFATLQPLRAAPTGLGPEPPGEF